MKIYILAMISVQIQESWYSSPKTEYIVQKNDFTYNPFNSQLQHTVNECSLLLPHSHLFPNPLFHDSTDTTETRFMGITVQPFFKVSVWTTVTPEHPTHLQQAAHTFVFRRSSTTITVPWKFYDIFCCSLSCMVCSPIP